MFFFFTVKYCSEQSSLLERLVFIGYSLFVLEKTVHNAKAFNYFYENKRLGLFRVCDLIHQFVIAGVSVAEWLARRFNPSAEDRRAGSISVVTLGVVCLSLLFCKNFLCGYPVYGDVFLALCDTLWCMGFM